MATKLVNRLVMVAEGTASDKDRVTKSRELITKLKDKFGDASGVSKLDAPGDLNRKLVLALRALAPSHVLWSAPAGNTGPAADLVGLMFDITGGLGVHQWDFEIGVDTEWNGYGTVTEWPSLLYIIFTRGSEEGAGMPEPAGVVQLVEALLNAGADPTVHKFAIFRAVYKLQWFQCLNHLIQSPHCAAHLVGKNPSPILHMVLHDALKDAAKAANADAVKILLDGGVPPERPSYVPAPPASEGLYSSATPLIATVGGTRAQQKLPGGDEAVAAAAAAAAEAKAALNSKATRFDDPAEYNSMSRLKMVGELRKREIDYGGSKDEAYLRSLLVANDAAAAATSDAGDPALLDIAERRVVCLTLLLDAGADASVTDGEGHTAAGYSNLVSESGMPSVSWGVWDDPPPLNLDHLPWGTLKDEIAVLEHAIANPGSRPVSMMARAAGVEEEPVEGDGADTEEWAVSDDSLVRRNTGQNVLPTAVTVLRNRGKKKSSDAGIGSPRSRKKATNTDRESREVKMPGVHTFAANRAQSIMAGTVQDARIQRAEGAPTHMGLITLHTESGVQHRISSLSDGPASSAGLKVGDLLVRIGTAGELEQRSHEEVLQCVQNAGRQFDISFVRDDDLSWITTVKIEKAEDAPLMMKLVTLDMGNDAYQHRVSALGPDGPAAKSGLKIGDIVSSVNAKMAAFLDHDEVLGVLKTAGTSIEMIYIRDGDHSWEDELEDPAEDPDDTVEGGGGARVSVLDDALAFLLDGDDETTVDDDGAAVEAAPKAAAEPTHAAAAATPDAATAAVAPVSPGSPSSPVKKKGWFKSKRSKSKSPGKMADPVAGAVGPAGDGATPAVKTELEFFNPKFGPK